MLTQIDDRGFEEVVKRGRVLLELGAPRCGPCQALKPILAAIAKEDESLVTRELDVDQYPDLAARLGVRGIPTLILFEDGKELRRRVGSASASVIRAFVDDA
jgi:thioredoxin 1